MAVQDLGHVESAVRGEVESDRRPLHVAGVELGQLVLRQLGIERAKPLAIRSKTSMLRSRRSVTQSSPVLGFFAM